MNDFPNNHPPDDDGIPRIISSHKGEDRTQGFLNTKPRDEPTQFSGQYILNQEPGRAFTITKALRIEESFST